MSINIHIAAKGKDSIKFPCEQTPTDASYRIMESNNPLAAYREYWLKRRHKGHVKELDKWVREISEIGLAPEVWVS